MTPDESNKSGGQKPEFDALDQAHLDEILEDGKDGFFTTEELSVACSSPQEASTECLRHLKRRPQLVNFFEDAGRAINQLDLPHTLYGAIQRELERRRKTEQGEEQSR